MEKTLKQKRGRAIGTKFAPPYSILFMAESEKEIERGYSEREVRKQILRARGFSRDSLLDGENIREEQNK